MTFHFFLLLLLLYCLMLYLARLCRLSWCHHCPAQLRVAARRTPIQRLLKPRSPHDCPVCRLSCAHSSVVESVSPAVRPWREVKSRRGAPKRVNTEGFACPNRKCPYSGITDAHIHALVGDGTHGHAERIQTFRCQACHTTFTARRDTPLYRLKTPSHQIAVVLAALAEGLDPSAAERVFGYRQTTITTWLSRAARARADLAWALLLQPPTPASPARRAANQAAQLRTRALAVAGHRPLHEDSSSPPDRPLHTKCSTYSHPLPATTPSSWLSAALHQRWVKLVFLCPHGPFWPMARRKSSRAPVAGGGGPDLRPGEKELPTA